MDKSLLTSLLGTQHQECLDQLLSADDLLINKMCALLIMKWNLFSTEFHWQNRYYTGNLPEDLSKMKVTHFMDSYNPCKNESQFSELLNEVLEKYQTGLTLEILIRRKQKEFTINPFYSQTAENLGLKKLSDYPVLKSHNNRAGCVLLLYYVIQKYFENVHVS